jgi:hypothetical protein
MMMHRLTTDNPTDNIEASLNLFYVRDGDAFIRGGGDAPDYADISVTDFIRKTARALCPDMLLPESAEEISFAMAEYLFDGYEEPSGLIALLYTAAWSYAELRERLKAYEDTGLSPEKVSWMKEVVEAAFDNDTSRIERAHNLHVADKEGRVVVLPCKVGDTVYFVNAKQILEFAVVGYAVDETGISWVYSEHVDKTGHTNERTFSPDRISKTTFLTREEAEKALAEMEGK